MKKKDLLPVPAVGGILLLTVFLVLELTVFSMLSLSTVLAEKQTADRTAEAAVRYYAADLEAQEIFARLRCGEQVPGVTQEGDRFLYACPVSENQTLQVRLRRSGDSWQILRWQLTVREENCLDTLPLWDGTR